METILGLIILELITSGISITTILKESLNIIKRAADEGYFIEIDKLKEIDEELKINGRKVSLAYLLIPGYNLALTLNMVMSLRKNQMDLLDRLGVLGILSKMSNLECTEYQKNPTATNALLISQKIKERLQNAKTISIDTIGLQGTITYDYQDGELTILKTTGNLLFLTEEKRKELVINNGVFAPSNVENNTTTDTIDTTFKEPTLQEDTISKSPSLKRINKKFEK